MSSTTNNAKEDQEAQPLRINLMECQLTDVVLPTKIPPKFFLNVLVDDPEVVAKSYSTYTQTGQHSHYIVFSKNAKNDLTMIPPLDMNDAPKADNLNWFSSLCDQLSVFNYVKTSYSQMVQLIDLIDGSSKLRDIFLAEKKNGEDEHADLLVFQKKNQGLNFTEGSFQEKCMTLGLVSSFNACYYGQQSEKSWTKYDRKIYIQRTRFALSLMEKVSKIQKSADSELKAITTTSVEPKEKMVEMFPTSAQDQMKDLQEKLNHYNKICHNSNKEYMEWNHQLAVKEETLKKQTEPHCEAPRLFLQDIRMLLLHFDTLALNWRRIISNNMKDCFKLLNEVRDRQKEIDELVKMKRISKVYSTHIKQVDSLETELKAKIGIKHKTLADIRARSTVEEREAYEEMENSICGSLALAKKILN